MTGLFHTQTLNLSHVSDGLDTHIKVLQFYIFTDAYSFLFLYYVEPMYVCTFLCPPYVYTFIQREHTHSELCAYMHTHVYLEGDGICDMEHSFVCIFVTHVFTRVT